MYVYVAVYDKSDTKRKAKRSGICTEYLASTKKKHKDILCRGSSTRFHLNTEQDTPYRPSVYLLVTSQPPRHIPTHHAYAPLYLEPDCQSENRAYGVEVGTF